MQVTERVIKKHSEALAIELKKTKKEKKWRGDGKGNLIENRAVEDCMDTYCYIYGNEIMVEAGLSYSSATDAEAARCLRKKIETAAMSIAKAKFWTP